ncbi:MAG: YceI family protein [Deltaproteobacteria bacterium]|nr:YceI family protein [Deltaproteobacteria bacterium]
MKTISLLTVLAPLALLACDADPAAGKARATAASAAPVATAAAGAAKLAFSAQGSKVEYVGAKVTGKHTGGFGAFKGQIALSDGAVEKSQVSVEVETASLTSDSDMLTGHLKGADFFNVEKFPKASFTSTAIKAGGEGGATHTVTGNLELHGVTKSVSFPATIKLTGDGADVDAEFAINRKDFGIAYPGKPDDLIKDDVLIKLTIRAKKTG